MNITFFHSKKSLKECIDNYFKYIEGDYHLEDVITKTKGETEVIQQKVWNRGPEPPTISGLAFYLGFESRKAFDEYEQHGRYGQILKRGRLRIEAEYEKKLHQQSSAGAIFALKAMGWNEKTDAMPLIYGDIKIEIVDNGHQPAASEKDVML